MEISQGGRRVSRRGVACLADMARLRRSGYARLQAVLFRLSQAARIACLHMNVERGVLERRDAPLRPAPIVVAGDVCLIRTTVYDVQNYAAEYG